MYLNKIQLNGGPAEIRTSQNAGDKDCHFNLQATKALGFEKLLTPKRVADMLGASVDWAQAHATRKYPRIDHVRAGKLIRFTPQQVAGFVRRQAVTHKS